MRKSPKILIADGNTEANNSKIQVMLRSFMVSVPYSQIRSYITKKLMWLLPMAAFL